MDYVPLDHEYDAVPYSFLTHSSTHPNHLASLGILLGLNPAPPDNCRVLEIGCALGGNIIPMAYSLPKSTFLGVDYSARQIEEGRKIVDELDLHNIELRRMDIMGIPEDLGTFDYIIAHGVYSWIAEPVRDKLLSVCSTLLARQGITFVSYNTYPGWRMLEIARDLMFFASRNETNPKDVVQASQNIVNFMVKGIPEGLSAYREFFESYNQTLSEKRTGDVNRGFQLLLHDELATVNQPIYFRDFMSHADSHGLQYLVESNFSEVMTNQIPESLQQEIDAMSDNLIEFEQYVDFLKNKYFRRTLLCHKDIDIKRNIRPGSIMELRFMSRAKPETDKPDLSPGVKENFKGSDGTMFTTDHPLTKAALLYLRENQPRSISFSDLLNIALEEISEGNQQDRKTEQLTLAASFLQAYSYSSNLIDLEAVALPFTIDIGSHPRASSLALWQIAHGLQATNLRHERVELDNFSTLVLSYLDGDHSLSEIYTDLVDRHKRGDFEITGLKDKVSSEDEISQEIQSSLNKVIGFLARVALLEA